MESKRKELKEQRDNLVLYKRPFRTLYLSSLASVEYVIYAVKAIFSSLFVWLLVPLILAYTALKYSEQNVALVEQIDSIILFATWWIGLGVLSSVGLGTGMHSGMLFLFPHIFSVVSASKRCPSMDFDSFSDMWWQDCDMVCTKPQDPTDVASLLTVILRVLPAAVLWGSGTAVGEIPPYLVSRAAALAGESDEELENETKGDDAFSKMKKWMIDFVEQKGFWGVLIMSAWPNAAFDLVGICCGQLGVPFFGFFIPTLIGKGLIKVGGQTVFFCTWFRHPELVIEFFVGLLRSVNSYVPLPLTEEGLRIKLLSALDQVSKGRVEEGEDSLLKVIGSHLVLVVMILFLLSTVQQIAQMKQKELDDKTLTKLSKSK